MKYILYPGEVWSVNDGQVHYINANQLMKLYGVSPKDCVEYHDYMKYNDGKTQFDMIPLYPRRDGRYDILKKARAET